MLLVVMHNETVFKYMGFLNGKLGKGLFLVFLASLAMGAMDDTYQIIAAIVMCVGAGLHFLRYCLSDDESDKVQDP